MEKLSVLSGIPIAIQTGSGHFDFFFHHRIIGSFLYVLTNSSNIYRVVLIDGKKNKWRKL